MFAHHQLAPWCSRTTPMCSCTRLPVDGGHVCALGHDTSHAPVTVCTDLCSQTVHCFTFERNRQSVFQGAAQFCIPMVTCGDSDFSASPIRAVALAAAAPSVSVEPWPRAFRAHLPKTNVASHLQHFSGEMSSPILCPVSKRANLSLYY